ncbi:MAG: PQQ-dependent sugar dehydrogenase, partial [Chitinophagales bacterium]
SIHSLMAQPTVNLVPFATGFSGGISDIANAGDNRLFVVEQLGYISIVDSAGNVMPNYFLDIHSKVTPTTFSPGNEQGLLGLAFSPDFATDGVFYVNYTDKNGVGNTVISRFTVSANPDIADPASEEIILNVYQPFSNHNGGSLAFGDDGYLYVALGDGGDAGDPGNRAQNPDSLLGKILRIDVSVPTGYAIPPTNPFATAGGAPEVWAYGLRNPWKITFDRDNHNLWIGDVGQFDWEEIDFQPAASTGGENYGWRCYEANHPYNTTGCSPISAYVAPVFEYDHNSTAGCAVTGGYVYRGIQFPALSGYYFFSDYCNGVINTLSPAMLISTAGTFGGNMFTTFGENYNGELFISSQSNGTVFKIIDAVTGIEAYSDQVNNLTIFPNPGYGLFTCEFDAAQKINVDIEIADLTGRVFYRDQKSLLPGHNNFDIDLKGVSSGSYQLKISSADVAVYKKFEIIK